LTTLLLTSTTAASSAAAAAQDEPQSGSVVLAPLSRSFAGAPYVDYTFFLAQSTSAGSIEEVLFLDSRTLAFRLKRPLLAAEWHEHVVTQPPVLLDDLLASLKSALSTGSQHGAAQSDFPRSIFRTTLPQLGDSKADASLLSSLASRGVRVSASAVDSAQNAEDLEFAVRLSLLLGASAFILNADGGVGSLLKRPARLYANRGAASRVTFANVAGCDEAKQELADVVDWLRNPGKYKRLGGRVPRGVLLVGPPGTGKTLLAQAVAGEASVPFFSASASEFVELFVGLGGRRVRTLFEEARKKAPCVIFIDELDAVGKTRSGGPAGGSGVAGVANEEREQTLNQLLTEMDGFETADSSPVIILAATNRQDSLDPALRRPGRFDRTVAVSAPDRAGRAAVARVHLSGLPSGALGELTVDDAALHIAASTGGFTGADLANVTNEAALLAARRGAAHITLSDLDAAIERGAAGLERPSLRLSPNERRTIAIHEAGHAVVAHLAASVANVKVSKISIVPRGTGALGWTQASPEEELYLASVARLRAMLAVLLAGRAAEAAVCGEITTGASDDLRRATAIATDMVATYGMCATLGPRAIGQPGEFGAPAYGMTAVSDGGGGGSALRAPGQLLASKVDDAVDALLRGAESWAAACVTHNQAVIGELAEALLRDETLSGEALQAVLARVQMPPRESGAVFWMER